MHNDIGFANSTLNRIAKPASLFERYCAYVVDVVLVFTIGILILYILSLYGKVDFHESLFSSAGSILTVYYCFYFSLLGYDWLFLPSLGRRLMGLLILYNGKSYKEYKENYSRVHKPIDLIFRRRWDFYKLPPPEQLRAIVRTLLIPLFPFSIIIALSNKRRQMLHDLCFDTVTVRESEPPTKIIVEAFTIFITTCVSLFLANKYFFHF